MIHRLRIINLTKEHGKVKLLRDGWLSVTAQHGVGVMVNLSLNTWEQAIVILHLNHGVLQVALLIGK